MPSFHTLLRRGAVRRAFGFALLAPWMGGCCALDCCQSCCSDSDPCVPTCDAACAPDGYGGELGYYGSEPYAPALGGTAPPAPSVSGPHWGADAAPPAPAPAPALQVDQTGRSALEAR